MPPTAPYRQPSKAKPGSKPLGRPRPRVASLLVAAAVGLSACSGGQPAAAPDQALKDSITETKELAYEAALAAAEAKSTAEEALAAAQNRSATGGEGTGSEESGSASEEPAADTAASAPAPSTVHWSYEGEAGPDKWPKLSADFATCESGLHQSPIDLTARTLDVGLDDLKMAWAPSDLTVVDNGHTIQANVAPGNTTTIDGVVYNLVQFHFHRPSEHTLGTEVFPMELHFVHKNAAGGLAVVGVLIQAGAANPAYETLWAAQPKAEAAHTAGAEPKAEATHGAEATHTAETTATAKSGGHAAGQVAGTVTKTAMSAEPTPTAHAAASETAAPAGTKVSKFDLASLLPANLHTYRYPGSLTTPPCTEGVAWNVLATPATASQAQIDDFRYEHNARPAQPLGDRLVLADKS